MVSSGSRGGSDVQLIILDRLDPQRIPVLGTDLAGEILLHETRNGYAVYVKRGAKTTSRFDYVVKHRGPGTRMRSISNAHLIVDLLQKRAGDPVTTAALIDYIVEELVAGARPIRRFPPPMPIDPRRAARTFLALDMYGEYEVEFLLAVEGLIAQSEKTNYPNGVLQDQLWQAFRDGADTFTLLRKANYFGAGRRQV
jgi:hypothetical protein